MSESEDDNLPEPSGEPRDRGEPITIEDFERELSERHLEEQVQRAEVTAIDPRRTPEMTNTDKALLVKFETVSGWSATDLLPLTERFDRDHSDLACLIQFTDAEPNNLATLRHTQVPFRDGEVQYAVMRDVLAAEDESVGDGWDVEKRLNKATRFLNDQP